MKTKKLGTATTIGELRKMTADYPNDMPFGFRNQAMQVLEEITYDDEMFVCFATTENQLYYLNDIAYRYHQKAKSKGFWDKKRETGTLLMLVVSELAEALEADRKGRHADINTFNAMNRNEVQFRDAFNVNIKDSFEDEISDTFIRLFDLCGALNIDIAKHIELKMKYNATREYKHGKKY